MKSSALLIVGLGCWQADALRGPGRGSAMHEWQDIEGFAGEKDSHIFNGKEFVGGELKPHIKVNDIFKPKACYRSADKEDYVGVHYVGSIADGSKGGTPGMVFDKTFERPVHFQLEKNGIVGWSHAMKGMCPGYKAIVIIPPELGFHNQTARFPAGDVPPMSTLNYTITLVDILDEEPPAPDFFKEIDLNDDGIVTKVEALAHFERHGRDSIPEGMWESVDKDGDGILTWDEFHVGPYTRTEDKDEL